MTTNNKHYVIECEDLRVSYRQRDGTTKPILSGINLKVARHEFLALCGGSGSGKTTLVERILGARRPTSGVVRIDGNIVTGVTGDCGIVYQDYSLFPHITVRENIAVGLILERTTIFERLRYFGAYRRARKSALVEAEKLIGEIGLSSKDGHKYPHELSGGMKQRVAFVQATIMHPKILLLDEPLASLDPSTSQAIQLFILDLWEKSDMTIIVICHDTRAAVYMATRVVQLSPHWLDDSGHTHDGSVIVFDEPVPGKNPAPTTVRYTAEYNAFLERIEGNLLKPNHKQRISEFNLAHKDALPPSDPNIPVEGVTNGE